LSRFFLISPNRFAADETGASRAGDEQCRHSTSLNALQQKVAHAAAIIIVDNRQLCFMEG
jgi:hypothetical protein